MKRYETTAITGTTNTRKMYNKTEDNRHITFNSLQFFPTAKNLSYAEDSSSIKGGVYASTTMRGGAKVEVFGGTKHSRGDGVTTYDLKVTSKTGKPARWSKHVRLQGIDADEITSLLLELQRRKVRR